MPTEEAVPIFAMPGTLVQEILDKLQDAPLGGGMTARENAAFCMKIMHTAEPPGVAAEQSAEPAPAPAEQPQPDPGKPCPPEGE